jgi:hypothetical protein
MIVSSLVTANVKRISGKCVARIDCSAGEAPRVFSDRKDTPDEAARSLAENFQKEFKVLVSDIERHSSKFYCLRFVGQGKRKISSAPVRAGSAKRELN